MDTKDRITAAASIIGAALKKDKLSIGEGR